jgi:probable rRNA maturation factor
MNTHDLTLVLDIQDASGSVAVPTAEAFELWIGAALAGELEDAEVSLRIVDAAEITALNHQYRDKNYATNVLSFPADLPEELGLPLLGDIVICADVVEREAIEQSKTSTAHWAHMVVHGTLHLLGYDHIDDDEAECMEGREIEILQQLNFPNPYQVVAVATADDLTDNPRAECSTQNHV